MIHSGKEEYISKVECWQRQHRGELVREISEKNAFRYLFMIEMQSFFAPQCLKKVLMDSTSTVLQRDKDDLSQI
jgi:hypothetical protein